MAEGHAATKPVTILSSDDDFAVVRVSSDCPTVARWALGIVIFTPGRAVVDWLIRVLPLPMRPLPVRALLGDDAEYWMMSTHHYQPPHPAMACIPEPSLAEHVKLANDIVELHESIRVGVGWAIVVLGVIGGYAVAMLGVANRLLGARLRDLKLTWRASAVWLCLAVGMGVCYTLLAWMGWFYETASPVGLRDAIDAFWFSFVTQATVGFGDVTPYTTVARLGVVVQTTAGWLLYAAIAAGYTLDLKAVWARTSLS